MDQGRNQSSARRRVGAAAAVAVGLATIGLTIASPASGGAPQPNGTLYYSRDSTSELYVIDLTDGSATLIGTTGVTSATTGLTEGPVAGELIASTWTDLSNVNADGSGFTVAGTDQLQAEGLAFDANSGVLYKILNSAFATADLTTGATVADLAQAPSDLEGIAWREVDDAVYAFGGGDSNLYRYDIDGDEWTLVGDTAIPETNSAGLAWDPSTDRFYGMGEDQNVYAISPTTGASVLIGNTGIAADGDGGGLAFIGQPAPPSSLAAGEPVGEPGEEVTFPVSGTCGTDASSVVSVSLTGPDGVTAGPVDGTVADDGTWTASLVVPAAPEGTYTISGTCTIAQDEIVLTDVEVVLSATVAPPPPPSEPPGATPVAGNPRFTG